MLIALATFGATAVAIAFLAIRSAA